MPRLHDAPRMQRHARGRIARALGAIGILAVVPLVPAAAQSGTPWPQRPIRMIVTYAPGGGSDILARFLAPRATADLGQQIVVDNRPGGNATIGSAIIARAAPDGYTIGMIDTALTINPGLLPKVPYDAEKDFAPVTLVAASPLLLVTHVSVPVTTVGELVALAKAKPKQLNFSSAGNGTAIHLALEQFRLVAGIDTIHIPYKGGGPSVADLIAGQVNYTVATPATIIQHVKGGRARALAVTSPKRLAALPDVPTIAEAGYPGVDANPYWGVVAPAGTPKAVVDRLHAVFVKHLTAPDLRTRLVELDFVVVANTPAEFGQFVKSEIPKWSKVIKASGAKVD